MNCPFAENGCLDRDIGFLVIMFQRQEQRQIGITVESVLINAGVDGAEAGKETVVGQIKFITRLNELLLAAAVELRAEADPHRIPHVNQPPNPRARFDRHIIQWPQLVIFPDANAAIFVDAKRIGLDVVRRGNVHVETGITAFCFSVW